DGGIEEDGHPLFADAAERILDVNPALEKSPICFGCRAVSGSLGDHKIKSAHDGFSLCCGRESFPGTVNLDRIKPEVLGNSAMILNGHGSSFFPI
ncbi:MAG: hypothetical protein WBQ94_01190, partial [Terracidiphilus sp.]